MKKSTFYAALESTARIAGCLTLIGGFGCASKEKVVENPASQNIQKSQKKPPTAADKLAAEKRQQCFLEVNETFAQREVSVSQRTVECCDMIVESVESDPNASLSPHLRNDCCDVLDWKGSETCKPWSPPAPPKND